MKMNDDEYEEFIKSIPPENWHCQKCARQFVYNDSGVGTYACNYCEMMWPADFIVQFGYADLTR